MVNVSVTGLSVSSTYLPLFASNTNLNSLSIGKKRISLVAVPDLGPVNHRIVDRSSI